MAEILKREKNKEIEILTLNDPGKLNALSEKMLSELQKALNQIALDKKIKAVIIRANGKAFCAGHDLKQMQQARQAEDGGNSYFNWLFKTCGQLMMTISKLPQPVIAEVNGIATAAGCQLVATCDLAVATSKATFGVNGVNIGLFCSTPMVALSRNIGRKKTLEMLLTGDFISAEEAYQLGLINKVLPEEKIKLGSIELASRIATKLSRAVKIGKETFYKQNEMGIEEAYNFTAEVMAENMMFEDTNEGISAFIEKRQPIWEN